MSKANSAVLCLSHELNTSNQLSTDSIIRLEKSFELDTKETRRRCGNINKRWDKQLKKVAKMLDLPKISPMWARHQRGTHFKEQELSLEEINLLYGHGDMKTTEAYVHSLPTTKKIKDLAQKLDSELM